MCHFLRIDFTCGHQRNTKALVLCSNPRGCSSRELTEVGADYLERLDHSAFANNVFPFPLTNVICDGCLRMVYEKIQENNSLELRACNYIQDLESKLGDALDRADAEVSNVELAQQDEIDDLRAQVQDLQLELRKERDRANSETRKANIAQLIADSKAFARPHHGGWTTTTDRAPLSAPTRMHTMCASGRCSSQAVVCGDGRRGEFCREHTCSARDWGCLQDAYHSPLGEERPEDAPRFCPAHTCCVTGCGARVLGKDEWFCQRHGYLKGNVMAMSVMVRGRQGPRSRGGTA
ncbi:hypothetical protein ACO1O0_008726 [Amphichorda felina]